MTEMRVSRRDFLKLSGGATGAVLLMQTPRPALAEGSRRLILKKKVGEVASICPYCAVGCGVIVATEGGRVTNIEGDPDHPINQGALCSKGSALFQVANNERRLKKVLYRAPGGDRWEERDWDWALGQIARRIKETRDANWIEKDQDGYLVNRTEAIACLGGAAHDNEECYAMSKAMRSLGLVYIEHQARL